MLAGGCLNLKQAPISTLVFRSLNFKAFRLSSLIDSPPGCRGTSWQLNHFEMPIRSVSVHVPPHFTYPIPHSPFPIPPIASILARCVIQLANAKLTANKASASANDEPKLNSMPPRFHVQDVFLLETD